MTRAVVLQGSDLLVRGDLAVAPDVVDADGAPINAVLATIKALRRTLAMKQPDLGIAVLGPAPKGLEAQHALLPSVFEAHGFVVEHSKDPTRRVGAYVNGARDGGAEVVVVGYDKRLAQLVEDGIWFYDAYKDVRYTPDTVRKRFDVPPEWVAAWLALVGDRYATEGVKGVGAKGAAGLLADHGSIQAALEVLDTLKGRTGNALRAAGPAAVLAAVAAATLDDAGVVPPAWSPPTKLEAFYASLGFLQLVSGGEAESVDVCKDVSTLDLSGPVSIEALCTRPSPARGRLVGLALSSTKQTVFVPVSALAGLQDWLASDAPKLGHDTKRASVALARIGLVLGGVFGDSCILSHLLDPSGMAPHELSDLTKRFLKRALQSSDEVLGKGARRKDWDQVPVEQAAAWAGARARAAREVWDALAGTFDPALHDDAMQLSDVLVGMELRGIPVDAADLAESGADFEAIGAELESQIFALAGHDFSINSTKQLGTVLYEEIGLPVVAKTKTGWSTANHALERLEGAHPIVPLVIRWRRLRRLRDSWITALTKAIDADGRVRSTFHPARSFSGRLVNAHPDLGRVPGRTPEMSRIRHAFRAPPGHTLLSIDYDQLGLYVLAHLTQEPNLVGPLSRGEDIHTATAQAVLEKQDIDVDERQLGKVVNFATFAGQGPSSLGLQLGLSAAEARTLIDRFFVRYAAVREFLDEQLRLAQTQGHITTLAGRPWRIHDLSSKNPMTRGYAERLARRATHEGSVADVTRAGLVKAAGALQSAGLLAFPLLQIHDEILFEVPDGELEAVCEVAGQAMRTAYDLVVPLQVGFKTGPSWSELT